MATLDSTAGYSPSHDAERAGLISRCLFIFGDKPANDHEKSQLAALLGEAITNGNGLYTLKYRSIEQHLGFGAIQAWDEAARRGVAQEDKANYGFVVDQSFIAALERATDENYVAARARFSSTRSESEPLHR